MDSHPAADPEGGARPTTKDLALQAIAALPDDADFEDVIERLQFVYEVQRGLDDLDAGRVAPQDEVRRRMARWLE
jgi:predicted transcriptional regulator